jgi:hypothetical protein
MENNEQDYIVFEADDGAMLEFTVMHEFRHGGGMYAVLRRTGDSGDTLIAEILDPMGSEEEFVPLPLKQQQELLDYLNRDGNED